MYSLRLRYKIQIRWTHVSSHLPQQRCGDAVVESAEAVSLEHADTHPEHPILRLLLCLQVNLRDKFELCTNPDSLCCFCTRFKSHINHRRPVSRKTGGKSWKFTVAYTNHTVHAEQGRRQNFVSGEGTFNKKMTKNKLEKYFWKSYKICTKNFKNFLFSKIFKNCLIKF